MQWCSNIWLHLCIVSKSVFWGWYFRELWFLKFCIYENYNIGKGYGPNILGKVWKLSFQWYQEMLFLVTIFVRIRGIIFGGMMHCYHWIGGVAPVKKSYTIGLWALSFVRKLRKRSFPQNHDVWKIWSCSITRKKLFIIFWFLLTIILFTCALKYILSYAQIFCWFFYASSLISMRFTC